MKKILVLAIVILAVVVITGQASAWWAGVYRPHVHYWGWGVVGPRVVWAPPFFWGPPIYYGSYYPPYGYYGPRDDQPWVWVPGHWGERQTQEGGSTKVWIPGHWKYKP
jgi:hypothetical protein